MLVLKKENLDLTSDLVPAEYSYIVTKTCMPVLRKRFAFAKYVTYSRGGNNKAELPL